MGEPVFLTVAEVIRVHAAMVQRYGGLAGVRDPGLLESAVETARATYDGHRLHADVFEMAAAYLFHIVGNTRFTTATSGPARRARLCFLN